MLAWLSLFVLLLSNQALLFYELSWIDEDKLITEKIAQQTLLAQKINLFDKLEKENSYIKIKENHLYIKKKIKEYIKNYNETKFENTFNEFIITSKKISSFEEIQLLSKVEIQFLDELNIIRNLFNQKKDNDKNFLVNTEIFITILFFIVLIAQWLTTFKPMWIKLRTMSIEVTDINNQLSEQVNEISMIEKELRQNMEELEILNENLYVREQKSKEQEILLGEIQKFAGLGYFEMDFINQTSIWSDTMYQIFGVDVSTIPPYAEEYFDYIHPQDREKALQIWEKLKTEEMIEFTKRIIRSNNETKYLTIKIQNKRDTEGKKIGIQGTAMDVTLLKQAQIELENIHEDVLDSLNYAQRIQNAILPHEDILKKYLPNNFVLYVPKDIVSGDFYWISHRNYKTILVVADCTGHGIPGAFMSFIGTLLLNEIVNFRNIISPEEILNELRAGIKKALRQEETSNHDGMDATVLTIDQFPAEYKEMLGSPKIEFAGANNPLYYIQNGELKEIKGSSLAIGGVDYFVKEDFFRKHEIEINTPTMLYMFSDGYQDQFGGERNSRFTTRRLKNLLLEIHEKPLEEQRTLLRKNINEWTKNTRQIDDILIVGIRLFPV
ncbi:MAG: hypothetical protein EAZ44_00215 [Cytophagia bacterium]|nr:MAG: hypothetical protein EAZ44_00215 [Cytophagia bacterium]TAG44655.1 MAG: hypothetical protein EAZ31_01980 [Cytophagia bacterium]TAH30687.1 MAG: hypothetical protein EAZ06_02355 [Cytophagales bacterium]